MKQFCIFFTLFFFYWPKTLIAQTYQSESVPLFLKAKNQSVFGINKDPFGFMWFCTTDGLKKFNAYDIKSFNNKEIDTTSIGSNLVFKSTIDKNGNHYLATLEGLSIYDRKKGKFLNLDIVKSPVEAKENIMTNIFLDSKNRVWISTVLGLYYYDIKQKKIVEVISDNINSQYYGSPFSTILEDVQGNIWVANSGRGIYKLEGKSLNIVHFSIKKNNAPFLNHDFVTHISLNTDQVLWISTYKGVSSYDIKTGAYQKFFHDPKNAKSLISDSTSCIVFDRINKNNIWIGTLGKGIERLNVETREFTHLRKSPSFNISSDYIISGFQDKNGILWIGTDKGLDKIFNHFKRFNSFSSPFKVGEIVAMVNDNKNNLWLCSSEDYNLLSYNNNPSNPKTNNFPGMGGDRMIKDQYGNIWIARDTGVVKMNPETKKVKWFIESPKTTSPKIKSKPIWTMKFGFNGKLWLGTGGSGMKYLDTVSGTFNYYSTQSNNIKIPDDYIGPILEDEKYIWIGTYSSGLCRLDKKTNEIKSYKKDSLNENSILSNQISLLFKDSKNNFWVGTNKGISKFDIHKEVFTAFPLHLKKENKEVYSMFEDKKGFLWLNTLNYICRIDPKTSVANVYDEHDGVDWNFDWGKSFKDQTGRITFGGEKGYVSFHPEQLYQNPHPPEIAITSVNSEDKNLLPNVTLDFIDTIKLNYNQNSFNIQFSALNFLGSEKNQYAYFLKGYDKNFNFSGAIRKASYFNIPPGVYEFHVIASNNDLVWNKNGKKVTIIIHPAFYQTWWFKGLIGFLIFSVAIVLYKVNNKKKEIAEIKTAPRKSKENVATIDEQVAKNHLTQLDELMLEKKLYLEEEIDQYKLAKELSIPVYLLSKILNEHLKMTFNAYINHLRIEEAKRILLTVSRKEFTNFGIAKDCGYKNETVFYRNFKKITGLTPAEFRKKNLEEKES